MLFVLGSVLTNVLLLIWLRLLRVPIPTLVTLNYFVCVGLAALMDPLTAAQLRQLDLLALGGLGVLGVLFVSIFILTGEAAREMGIGLTGMLTKLSVVLPIGFAALFLREPVSPLQSLGILAGLGAIIAVHVPYLQDGGWRNLLRAARLGLLLWLGNGVIDILFKALQPRWGALHTLQVPLVIMSVAGALGILWHALRDMLPLLYQRRIWLAALLLGTTNLLSIFFYLKALGSFPAVQFFLWNNLGIVLLSGLAGMLFFRERLTPATGIGYLLGITAIFLVR